MDYTMVMIPESMNKNEKLQKISHNYYEHNGKLKSK